MTRHPPRSCRLARDQRRARGSRSPARCPRPSPLATASRPAAPRRRRARSSTPSARSSASTATPTRAIGCSARYVADEPRLAGGRAAPRSGSPSTRSCVSQLRVELDRPRGEAAGGQHEPIGARRSDRARRRESTTAAPDRRRARATTTSAPSTSRPPAARSAARSDLVAAACPEPTAAASGSRTPAVRAAARGQPTAAAGSRSPSIAGSPTCSSARSIGDSCAQNWPAKRDRRSARAIPSGLMSARSSVELDADRRARRSRRRAGWRRTGSGESRAAPASRRSRRERSPDASPPAIVSGTSADGRSAPTAVGSEQVALEAADVPVAGQRAGGDPSANQRSASATASAPSSA